MRYFKNVNEIVTILLKNHHFGKKTGMRRSPRYGIFKSRFAKKVDVAF